MKGPYYYKMLLFILPVYLLSGACSKSYNSTTSTSPTVTKHWDIVMNAKFEVPAPAGRSETGTATLDLYSDMTLKYSLSVTGLAAGDQLSASHIHVGDQLTSGPVIISFNPSFTNGSATGQVTIRSTLADSLKNEPEIFYVNVHSTQVPGGLLRGQLDNPVTFAQDIILTGGSEVPSVTTTATGLALLRLTSNKTLFAKVTVTGLEAGDVLTASHIHTGATGVSGSVIVPLCASASDFGMVLKIPALTDANVSLIQTGQVYVNAHSQNHPAGLIRGQIR